MTDPGTDRILLGRITGPWGVRGWVKVYSYTDPLDNIFAYGPWWLRQRGRETRAEVVEYHVQGRKLHARLDRCETREDADGLTGAEILVAESCLPELEEGDYYWRDLVGLQVCNSLGEPLGRVGELIETGASDVLVVETGGSEGEKLLIPWVPGHVVLDVDLGAGMIRVDWEADW